MSIISNIAEGFERGSTVELTWFPYIAKGSGGEIRAQLAIALDRGFLSMRDYGRLHDPARRAGRMLSNLITHLQSMDYKSEKLSRLAATDTRPADLFARHGVKLPGCDRRPEDSDH